MKVILRQVIKARSKVAALYLVYNGEQIIGQLEKYQNTRTETHPWKAFHKTGFSRVFLGAFYPDQGGKDAAIRTILQACGKE